MIRGGIWIKSEACLGWLVGWFVFYTSLVSRSIEKRELKAAYILLLIIKKKPPGENVQQACDIGLIGRLLVYTRQTKQNNKSSKDPVWCHA